ncbi:MAG: hypothetical protein P1V81_09910 [Planctomycetota bacterium]|nr:hypothetical protein [Planctomycetota bacterium]
MLNTIRSLIALALCTLALESPVLAKVHIVDPGGGSAWAEIQFALNVAVDGDTILVRSGMYQPFDIVGKAVTIVGDTGAGVVVAGGIQVRDLQLGQNVVLRNLTLVGDQSTILLRENGLRVEDCLGAVRVEGCWIFGSFGHGASGGSELPGRPAVFAKVARDLAFHSCVIVGGKGAASLTGGPYSAGGHGAEVAGSVVSFHACQVSGALGAFGDDLGDGAPGGHGLFARADPAHPLQATRVHGAGSAFSGANGTTDALCFVAGSGGDGVRLEDVGTIATLLDNSYVWGQKGSCGIFGSDGQAISVGAGASYHALGGDSRDVGSNAPVRELGTLNLSFSGEAGDLGLLLLSAGPAHVGSLPWSGTQLISLPLIAPSIVAAKALPVGGTVQAQLPIPNLPAGVEGMTLYTQGVFFDVAGGLWLASPTTLVLLDQSF